jgi:SpoIID/LytB domain protein
VAWAGAVALVLAVLVPAPSAEAALEVYPVPSTRQFTVDGHGWGHGRGMSQYGSLEAARRGLEAGEILEHY